MEDTFRFRANPEVRCIAVPGVQCCDKGFQGIEGRAT